MNPDAATYTEWRSQLQPEARSRLVTKIMDTLEKHLPITGPDGLRELRKIAVQFEEKIYSGATSQADYLRKISMKMLILEQKTHGNGAANALATSSNIVNQVSPDAETRPPMGASLPSSGGGGWRPPQGDPNMNPDAASSSEWHSLLQPEARSLIVTKIIDTLKKHLPITGPEDLGELRKIAVQFEENIYSGATSQVDYLRKISMKMLSMEQKTHGNGAGNALATSSNVVNQASPDADAEEYC